jgi:hypothetical protein
MSIEREARSSAGPDADNNRKEIHEKESSQLAATLDLIDATLTIPAAEYVPAIGDVFLIIDEARKAAKAEPNPQGLRATPETTRQDGQEGQEVSAQALGEGA